MENLPVEIQSLLTQLLMAVVGLVVAVLGYYARLYIAKAVELTKAKIGAEQYAWALAFIETAVMAVAQNPAFKGFTGAELKEYVKKQALAFSVKYKLSFDEGEIDLMIEEAVKWMKYQFEFPELEAEIK